LISSKAYPKSLYETDMPTVAEALAKVVINKRFVQSGRNSINCGNCFTKKHKRNRWEPSLPLNSGRPEYILGNTDARVNSHSYNV